MFFKRGLKAASLCGMLLFSACGGGGSASSNAPTNSVDVNENYDLTLSSTEPVAGVQWMMNMEGLEFQSSELQTNAGKSLGASVRVLYRPAPQSAGTSKSNFVQWLLFAPDSAGRTNFVLTSRSSFAGKLLPAPESVLCADSYGNPVTCSLAWSQR